MFLKLFVAVANDLAHVKLICSIEVPSALILVSILQGDKEDNAGKEKNLEEDAAGNDDEMDDEGEATCEHAVQ